MDTSGSHTWFENKKTNEQFKKQHLNKEKNIKKFLKENPDLVCFSTLSMTSMGDNKRKQKIEFNGEIFEPASWFSIFRSR